MELDIDGVKYQFEDMTPEQKSVVVRIEELQREQNEAATLKQAYVTKLKSLLEAKEEDETGEE
jgi:FtsZ-binding cell division protein ZapB|tara:strand:- start:408 stop:596 length:189 start_codon:yes stop_codon:yes gene_type:complete